MKSPRLLLTTVAALAALLALLPDDAGAIPAFARRYKMSCTTCHAPFPRLKEFGLEFAANGFIIPEEEKDRDYVSAGDDLLHLNRDFPLAVRMESFFTVEEGSDVTTDFKAPWGMKLLSGGAVAQNVGYYFYFFMDEKGEVAGVEDAYVHFNNVGGRPFDIMVGQFQTSDPLMKRELRLTFEDYLVYKAHIGESQCNLTYDRGVMMTYDVESSGTGFVAQIVNGNGKPVAGANGNYDTDKDKNFGFRVTQGAGPLQLGYYYYYGQERRDVGDGLYRNRIQYHGPDLVVGNGNLDLTVQYLQRRDTNPTFIGGAENVKTDGVVAELVISPRGDRSRLYYTLLYNRIDSDIEEVLPAAGYYYDYETYTASATYLMKRNLRASLEYTYDAENELSRGSVGLVAAF